MAFKKPFFRFFKIVLIILILVSTVSTDPLFVQFRERWKCKNRDNIIKEIEICCNRNLYNKLENELCPLSDKSRQDLVDTIYDNECLDLYSPDDTFLFQKIELCNHNLRKCRKQICKVLGHVEKTPLTRCLYSNKYLCDSYTGYLSRDTEKKVEKVVEFLGFGYWLYNTFSERSERSEL